jgi:hypothetical protein
MYLVSQLHSVHSVHFVHQVHSVCALVEKCLSDTQLMITPSRLAPTSQVLP